VGLQEIDKALIELGVTCTLCSLNYFLIHFRALDLWRFLFRLLGQGGLGRLGRLLYGDGWLVDLSDHGCLDDRRGGDLFSLAGHLERDALHGTTRLNFFLKFILLGCVKDQLIVFVVVHLKVLLSFCPES